MKYSYFNYWWFVVTSGSFFALTVLVYIEDHVGFGWGYGIPTVGLALALAVFLLGTRSYRYKHPKGSPLTQVACVLVAAMRNRNVQVPTDSALLHEVGHPLKRNLHHTHHLRYNHQMVFLFTLSRSSSRQQHLCALYLLMQLGLNIFNCKTSRVFCLLI